ncbi:MAG: hypothetical protein ABI197_14430 [Granulicella sp.]
MSTPPIPPIPGSQTGSQQSPQPGFEQVIVPPAPQQASGYPPAPSQVYAQPGFPQTGYPPAGYPPPGAPKSGNTVLKIVLVVVGIFVLFGVIVAAVLGYGAYRLSKVVHRAASADVSFSTPNGGTIRSGNSAAVTASDIGIAEYPGAKRESGGMKMKTSAGSLTSAIYTTSDSVDQVATFYKSKLGEQANVMEAGGGTILTSGGDADDKFVVTITSDDGATKIAILHTSHLGSQ